MSLEGKDLVAYCGIYCGVCGAYKKGGCKGCRDGGGFKSCEARTCCHERNYATCAECDEFAACKKLDDFIAKFISLAFRQPSTVEKVKRIKEIGVDTYIKEQGENNG